MTIDASGGLFLVAVAALIFAALCDIALRIVPDWISGVILADGVVVRMLDHHLPTAIACGLVILSLAAFCWRRGWLGGGDVKLLGATAVLVPPNLVPTYIASVALAGGGLALLYLLLERIVPSPRPRQHATLPWRILTVECRRIRRRTSLPYATAITAGALLMLVKG